MCVNGTFLSDQNQDSNLKCVIFVILSSFFLSPSDLVLMQCACLCQNRSSSSSKHFDTKPYPTSSDFSHQPLLLFSPTGPLTFFAYDKPCNPRIRLAPCAKENVTFWREKKSSLILGNHVKVIYSICPRRVLISTQWRRRPISL